MELSLPEKPEKPLNSDCCGQGCTPCVLDIYQEELAIWERECARIKSGRVSETHEDITEIKVILSRQIFQSNWALRNPTPLDFTYKGFGLVLIQLNHKS